MCCMSRVWFFFFFSLLVLLSLLGGNLVCNRGRLSGGNSFSKKKNGAIEWGEGGGTKKLPLPRLVFGRGFPHLKKRKRVTVCEAKYTPTRDTVPPVITRNVM